jgi:transcriptional regulator with XRE-family HTH domain
MPAKHIVTAFLEALEREGINQARFADRCGVGSGYITRFVQGARPEEDFFRKICTKWENPKLGYLVMVGHLQDEIERGDLPVEAFTTEVKSEQADRLNKTSLDTTLGFLRKFALAEPSLEKLLEHLVEVAGPRHVRRKGSEGRQKPL